MHYHYSKYEFQYPHAVGLTTAIVYGIISAAGSIGSAAYSSAKSETLQKKVMDRQAADVAAAEEKVKGAEALATQQAADKLKKKRISQTQTILTSPLGVQENANVGMTTLLGG